MKSSNRELGNHGEDLACKFLEKNGYKMIEGNKSFSKFCEIDISAQIKNTLVFVEVKTRKTNSFGSPLEAITKTKYSHIRQGALTYLGENSKKFSNFRIDAIGITLEPKVEIKHLQNI